jgi:hypothetical protein
LNFRRPLSHAHGHWSAGRSHPVGLVSGVHNATHIGVFGSLVWGANANSGSEMVAALCAPRLERQKKADALTVCMAILRPAKPEEDRRRRRKKRFARSSRKRSNSGC